MIALIPVEIFQPLLIERQFFSRSMRNEFPMVDSEGGNKHPVLKLSEVFGGTKVTK